MIPKITRNYYTTDEAFDVLGQVLFPDEWEGNHNELNAYPYPPTAEAARNDHAIDQLIAEREQLLSGRFETQLKTQEKEALAAVEAKLVEWNDGQKYNVEGRRNYDKDANRHQRGFVVEKAIMDALREGKFKLLLVPGGTFASMSWWEDPEMRLSIRLGTVTVPLTCLSGGMYSARIEQSSFDDWLKSLPQFLDRSGALTDVEFANSWLGNELREHNQRKRMSREAYFELAKKKRPTLSERAFRQAWANTAPAYWKQKGRPKQ